MGLLDILTPIASIAGSIFSFSTSKSATQNAYTTNANALAQAQSMISDWMGKSKADIKAAVDQGLITLDEGFSKAVAALSPLKDTNTVNKVMEMVKDPNKARQDVSLTGQTNLANTMSKQIASKSPSKSTPTIDSAAEEFGRGYANNFINAMLNRYIPRVNRSSRASFNEANLHSNLGNLKAGLEVTGETGVRNVVASGTPALYSNANQLTENSMASGIQDFNNVTNLISNLVNSGGQLHSVWPKA